MSANTKIEWADHTMNPWIGCNPISPGCKHCYAADWAKRYGRDFAERTRTKTWGDPVRWNNEPFYQCLSCGWRGAEKDSKACEHGRDYPHRHCPKCQTTESLSPARARVFCASLADVFDNQVDLQWRADLFALIAATPNLDWLLLTKRIGNAKTMMADALHLIPKANSAGMIWPLPNVWLGATIVNQEEADRDIPKLLAVPAAKRFLSMEPLLGPVDLGAVWVPNGILRNMVLAIGKLDWVIVGGESGHSARPMHPDWACSLRNQCDAAGVPFMFKQWGEWSPDSHAHTGMCVVMADGEVLNPPNCLSRPGEDGEIMFKVGKKAAGRLLGGRTWDEVPS